MNLDPIDFCPGYEPYYCCRQQNRRRYNLANICSHILAMLFAIGICASAFYYYERSKNLKYEQFSDPHSYLTTPSSNMDDIRNEMDQIKQSLEDTLNWKKQLTDLFTKIYIQQESVIDKTINKALDIYDSDKIGLFDYASTYACGSIFSTPDTFPYPANKSISFFSLVNVDLLSNPNAILQPDNFPGNCFAFYGSTGRIRIKLGKKITIKAVTMDHVKLIEDASSAPREFEVFGLYEPLDVGGIFLGRFTYNLEDRPYQTFAINANQTNIPFEYVELYVLNNYGRREFTCVYRFRVHSVAPTPLEN